MRDGIKRKCCPKCGDTIVVSELYQTSHDYRVTKRGKLSKRFTRDGEHSIECAIASCRNCGTAWEADDFYIQNDCFYDLLYEDETE